MDDATFEGELVQLAADFHALGLSVDNPRDEFRAALVLEDPDNELTTEQRIAVANAVFKMELLSRLGRMYAYNGGGKGKSGFMVPRHKVVYEDHPDAQPIRLRKHKWDTYEAFAEATAASHMLPFAFGPDWKAYGFNYLPAFERLKELNARLIVEPLVRARAVHSTKRADELRKPGNEAAMALIAEIYMRGLSCDAKSLDAVRRAFRQAPSLRDQNSESRGRRIYDGRERAWTLNTEDILAIIDFLDEQRIDGPSVEFTIDAAGRRLFDHKRIRSALDTWLGDKEPKPHEVYVENIDEISKLARSSLKARQGESSCQPMASDQFEKVTANLRGEYGEGTCKRVILDNLIALTSGEMTKEELAAQHGFTPETVRVNFGKVQDQIVRGMMHNSF